MQMLFNFPEPWCSLAGIFVGAVVVGLIVQRKAWLYGLIVGLLVAIASACWVIFYITTILNISIIKLLGDVQFVLTRLSEPVFGMLVAEFVHKYKRAVLQHRKML